jgi:hypothetical protein
MEASTGTAPASRFTRRSWMLEVEDLNAISSQFSVPRAMASEGLARYEPLIAR